MNIDLKIAQLAAHGWFTTNKDKIYNKNTFDFYVDYCKTDNKLSHPNKKRAQSKINGKNSRWC